MRVIDIKQGSEAWLDWRKNRITGTDSPILMGESPYCTPHTGWQRKTGQIPELTVTPPMLRGQLDEPIARAIFNREYGTNMQPCCIESEIHPYLGASLDGMDESGEIIEIKSQHPSKLTQTLKAFVGEDFKMPFFHFLQVQHQLLCTDGEAKVAYYISHWEGENRTYKIYADEGWFQEYLPKAKKYWEQVLFMEAPALIAGDYRNMSSFNDWRETAREYVALCNQLKELEERKETLKKNLIAMSENRNCCGAGIKLIKKNITGRVDYSAIPELANVNLEQYRKKSTSSWTINLE